MRFETQASGESSHCSRLVVSLMKGKPHTQGDGAVQGSLDLCPAPVSHPPYPPQIDIYFTNLYLVNLIYGA